MNAARQHRSRSRARLFSALLGILCSCLPVLNTRASTATRLLLSRDDGASLSAEFKGLVDLAVDAPFDGAKIAISVDGVRIADALGSPYRVTVDFGPRTIEHKITVTAWSVDRKKRVQWHETINHGHRGLSVRLRAMDAASGTFEVVTTASGEDPIERVELWDDGKVVASASSAPYRFTVPASRLASGIVQVTVRTRSGEEAADYWSNGGGVHVENVEVRTVPLLVTVVDRSGKTRDDVDRSLFRIIDNNTEARIVEFGKAYDQPISIAILMDASASMTWSLREATRAATQFVDRTLKPNDRCMVLGIHEVPRRVQDLTSDRQLVKQALANMTASGATALYDAIDSAIRALKDEKNRRAIVVLSDGGDNASMASFEDTEKSAAAAGIPVYFVAYENLESSAQVDYDRMNVLARETGGFVAMSQQQTLTAKYSEIEKDLRAQFAILYQIADFAKHNEWRKVRVEIKSPRLTARTIGGYFAP